MTNDNRASPQDSADGAPGEEIEITPEMIRAGLIVLNQELSPDDLGLTDPAALVRDLYLAMTAFRASKYSR